MSGKNQALIIVRGIAGAAIGGALGYFAFFWIVRQGFYALIIPPALLGAGAGLCARGRSVPLAAICAVAGLALGLFTEWQFAPFNTDTTLSYFLTHVHELTPVTLIMLLIGTIVAYRFALAPDRVAERKSDAA